MPRAGARPALSPATPGSRQLGDVLSSPLEEITEKSRLSISDFQDHRLITGMLEEEEKQFFFFPCMHIEILLIILSYI